MKLLQGLVLVLSYGFGFLGFTAQAEEGVASPNVRFYPYMYAPKERAFNSPTMSALYHPDYGAVISSARVVNSSAHGASEDYIVSDLLSVRLKRFIYSTAAAQPPIFKAQDVKRFYAEAEAILPRTKGRLPIDDYFVSYYPVDRYLDTNCQLFDPTILLFDSPKQKRLNRRAKIETHDSIGRLFFISVSQVPVAARENCSGEFDGTVISVEARSPNPPKNVLLDGLVYLALPSGLSVFPKNDAFFETLREPFALSPKTWVVPDYWLMPLIKTHVHQMESQNVREKEKSLVGVAREIKAILTNSFPFR